MPFLPQTFWDTEKLSRDCKGPPKWTTEWNYLASETLPKKEKMEEKKKKSRRISCEVE